MILVKYLKPYAWFDQKNADLIIGLGKSIAHSIRYKTEFLDPENLYLTINIKE